MNREGPPPVDWDAPMPAEMKTSTDLTEPAKYYLVDIRDASAYAEGHIPNSVNIAARGRFENWVGTMVPWGSKLVLVGDADLLKEARHRLHRVGYRGDIMTLDSWKNAKLPLKVGESHITRGTCMHLCRKEKRRSWLMCVSPRNGWHFASARF